MMKHLLFSIVLLLSAILFSSNEEKKEKDKQEDITLVKKLKAGDKKAFWDLMVKYEKKIFGFCYRMLSDIQVSEDVARDTFIKAYSKIHQLKENAKFRPWLLKIARNRCMDEIKVKTANLPIEKSPLTSMEDSPEAMVGGREIEKIVKEEINKLKSTYKEIILLIHYECLSYEEAAETLDIPIGTVKSRLNRALATLENSRIKNIRG